MLYENKLLGRTPHTLFYVQHSRQCFNLYLKYYSRYMMCSLGQAILKLQHMLLQTFSAGHCKAVIEQNITLMCSSAASLGHLLLCSLLSLFWRMCDFYCWYGSTLRPAMWPMLGVPFPSPKRSKLPILSKPLHYVGHVCHR